VGFVRFGFCFVPPGRRNFIRHCTAQEGEGWRDLLGHGRQRSGGRCLCTLGKEIPGSQEKKKSVFGFLVKKTVRLVFGGGGGFMYLHHDFPHIFPNYVLEITHCDT
jgi:hypothetical protein